MTHIRAVVLGFGLTAALLPLAAGAAPEPKAKPATKAGEGTSKAEMPPKAKSASAEFERIKALKGTWKGTGKMHGKEEPVVVEYSVTSGGTAVVEKLSPGTPHEMVSVYHDENGKLVMTHYCALGNQPKLALQQSTPEKIDLNLAKGNAFDPKTTMHMHSLTILFNGKDKLTQEWTSYADGKKQETSAFTFTRTGTGT